METYELIYVLPGDTTPAKKKSTSEKVNKIVKTLNGKVEKSDEWGKIDLAYNISGNSSGVFVHSHLKLTKAAVKELASKLRMEEEILRYLLVKNEK